MEITKILSEVIRRIKVVSPLLENAVRRSVDEIWPECKTSDTSSFQVVGFKKGVLHLSVESHALMAEAKAFAADELRELINTEIRFASKKVTASAMNTRFTKDADYVTRIVFRIVGTQ